ncbi:hypothetical protein MHBO_003384 [Bonamia ostreae]|uniref:Uncharacterized protein n=1 Tax=Bonamia ostreae TaxID=126728 RepID=A0ABV2AQM7_9EUKA
MSEIAIKKFKNIFLNVLNNNTGYDIAPSSGKVIVFDKRLLLKDALLALIEQDSKCGVLFNYSNDKIEHIITVTDFISILLHYYDCEKNCNKDIEKLSISEWLGQFFVLFSAIYRF